MSGAQLTPCKGEGQQVPKAGGAYRYVLIAYATLLEAYTGPWAHTALPSKSA